MITIRGLAHVGVRVAEFSRSVEFYKSFGFEVTREDYDERIIVVRHASGVEINLLDSADDDNEGRNVLMDERARFAGYTHIALGVAEIGQVVDHLKALKIDITEGPVTFGDGSTSVFFRDPDRNVIEMSQPVVRQHLGHNDDNRRA